MTKISDERLEELREKLKPDCCFLMYGECSTLSCLKRDAGGIRAAMPIELVGCETLHMDIALRELRAYRKEGCVAVQRKDIEHLLEYWNGSENERAMSDALKYILGALEGLLAAAPEPQEEP